MCIGYIIGFKVIDNTIYHGPDSNVIKRQVFHDNNKDKYYRFIPVPYICPPMYKNKLCTTKTLSLKDKDVDYKESESN